VRVSRESWSHRRIETGILVCVVLLGAFLRLCWLGRKSLWLDEIFTAGRSLADNVLKTGQDPLHIAATQLGMALWGSGSDFVVRLPSAMAGILCVPAMFYLGRSYFSRGEALIGACLLAISPLHVRHSQEARHYAFFTLFSIISLISLDIMLKGKSRRAWVGFALATTLNLLTHKFSLFLLLAEILTALTFMLPRERGSRADRELAWQMILALGLIALLYMPSILLVWTRLHERGFLARSESIVKGMSLSGEFFMGLFAALGAGKGSALWLYAGLFAVGTASSSARRGAMVRLFLLALVLPLATLFVWRPSHFFSFRYVIFLVPPYLLMIARGVMAVGKLAPRGLALLGAGRLARSGAWRRWTTISVAGCLLALLVAAAVPTLAAQYSAESEDWRGVTAYLQRQLQDSDVVLCDGVLRGAGGDSARTERCLRYYFGAEYPQESIVRESGIPRAMAKVGDEQGEVWAVVFRGSRWLRRSSQFGVTITEFPKVSVVRLGSPHDTLRENSMVMLHALVELMPNRDATIDLYTALAQMYPASAEGHLYAGNARLAAGDADAAMREYQMAIEISPGLAGPHVRLGDACKEQGRFREAIDQYRQALELKPEWDREVWVHMRLADAFRGMGSGMEALAEYRRVLELDPNHALAKAALSELEP